jgi:ABC-type iron transport system FetAB ATPase subunit
VRAGRIVLDGVDFEAHAGSVTALVGDSGAGKTSLLRCMVGLDPTAASDALYEAVAIESLDPCELRRRVALVAQAPVMLPGDVRANLLYAQPDADAHASLAAVGLDTALLEREAEELSGE